MGRVGPFSFKRPYSFQAMNSIPATGMPAITVPMGFTYGALPAGLQILGRPYDELLLFRLAFAYEQGTHHRRPPAGFPAL